LFGIAEESLFDLASDSRLDGQTEPPGAWIVGRVMGSAPTG